MLNTAVKSQNEEDLDSRESAPWNILRVGSIFKQRRLHYCLEFYECRMAALMKLHSQWQLSWGKLEFIAENLFGITIKSFPMSFFKIFLQFPGADKKQ